MPSFGFVVLESNKPGKMNTDLLEELGVPKGPLYGEIKRGKHITLQNGKIVSFPNCSSKIAHLFIQTRELYFHPLRSALQIL